MKCSRFSSQSRNRQRSEAMREALRSRFCCHPSHALHRAFRGPAAAVAVDRVILVQVSYVAETRRSVSGVEHFSVPAPQTLTCKVFQGFEVVVGRSLSIKGSYPSAPTSSVAVLEQCSCSLRAMRLLSDCFVLALVLVWLLRSNHQVLRSWTETSRVRYT